MIHTILRNSRILVDNFKQAKFCNKFTHTIESIYLLKINHNTPLEFKQFVRREHSEMTQSDNISVSNDRSSIDKVFVQNNTEKNILTISFNFTHQGKSKQFNLTRIPTDALGTSIERIKLNLKRMVQVKKSKKYAIVPEDNPINEVTLTFNNVPVDLTTKNCDAWIDQAVMNIDGKLYEITTNSPMVESIHMPSCIMRGFVTMASVNLVNCTIDNCILQWFRQVSAKEKDDIIEADGNLSVDNQTLTFDGRSFYYKVSDGLVYQPTQEDLAHNLKFVCIPSNGVKQGPPSFIISDKPVELGPSLCPFEKRHQLTKERVQDSNTFRFVSYNILADLYADSDYSRTVLFGHCPSHALDIDYRRQLLLKEMFGYNADIYCLQEVDKKEFLKIYQPFFKVINNCSGVFDTKGGQVAEGEAIFFKDDKFSLIHTHKTLLSELIEDRKLTLDDNSDKTKHSDDNQTEHFILRDRNTSEAIKCLGVFRDIRNAILSKEQLKRRFCDRHTILQTTLLKLKNSTQNDHVLVANTHLYFAPDADHVRLLQGSVCAKYIEYIKGYYQDMLKEKNESGVEPRISVIFCGDMNSTPDCGLFRLLTQGNVDNNLPDWLSSGVDEAVVDLKVSTHLRFSSAYENIDYTNYTPEFQGCLDYIYYDRGNIICERNIPLPDHQDVTAIGGIPSDVFPSDHLALIADMKILTNK